MCFKTDIPKPRELPDPPSANNEAVRAREQRERMAIMTAGQGTAGTVKSDLAPADVQGAQQRRVLLGV